MTQKNEIILAARSAFIDKDILKFDKKYKTMLGERGVNLSGGQKQKNINIEH